MPSNPIQRKTRNAFLLGMLIMLLVAIIVLAILYFFVFAESISESQERKQGGVAYVYKLTSSVKSGESIEEAKLVRQQMYAEDVPADFVDANMITDLKKYKTKVALQSGTVTRLVEYNMLTLPSTLRVGDYVDVRFTMPSGQNFIVLSRKEVQNLKDTTVTFYLTEDEILMMSSAIIESYIMSASNLHVVQYVEAGLQEAATPTYSINMEVLQLIQAKNGVNIEDYAKINSSYSEELRNTIQQELAQYEESELSNIEEKMEKEKETSLELYLSGLEGY